MTEILGALAGLGVLVSLASAYFARQSLKALKKERLELAAPTPVPEVHRALKIGDDVWRKWVADGWTLAEAAAVKNLKDNNTKPDPADKRKTALDWVRQEAEKAGVEWASPQASFSAKLLEMHHHRAVRQDCARCVNFKSA